MKTKWREEIKERRRRIEGQKMRRKDDRKKEVGGKEW